MSDIGFQWNDPLVSQFAGFLNERLKYCPVEDIPQIMEAFKKGNIPKQGEWYAQQENIAKEQLLNRSDAWIKPEQPKPWTILTFRGAKESNKVHRWKLLDNGEYIHAEKPTLTFSLEAMLKGNGWTVNSGDLLIESVRRNSDGEVFTLGDRITHGLIIKISISVDNSLCYIHTNYSWYYIGQVQKSAVPKFKSTDGVDIFPGTPYWSVDTDFTVFFSGAAGDGSGTEPGRKYFSTDAAATQYSWDNKPIWSRKDFREIINKLEERIFTKTDSL